MEQFEKIFNVNDLTDYELGHLEYILNSPSYERVFRPYMKKMYDSQVNLMLLPLHKRQEIGYNLSTSELRIGAAFIKGFMKFFDKIVETTQVERMMRMQDEDHRSDYERARDEGLNSHPAMLKPEEDF